MFSFCCCIVWKLSGWMVTNFCGHNSNATIYQQVRWPSLVLFYIFSLEFLDSFIMYQVSIFDISLATIAMPMPPSINKSGGQVWCFFIVLNFGIHCLYVSDQIQYFDMSVATTAMPPTSQVDMCHFEFWNLCSRKNYATIHQQTCQGDNLNSCPGIYYFLDIISYQRKDGKTF